MVTTKYDTVQECTRHKQNDIKTIDGTD